MRAAELPAIPAGIAAQHELWSWRIVSAHHASSVMYCMTSPSGETRFLKVTSTGWSPSASAEAQRLRWTRAHAPVPPVLDSGADELASWVLTAGLRGRDATHAAFRRDVFELVVLLARGLRRFHEIPAGSCPFRFQLADALQVAAERLEAGRIDPVRDFHQEHAHLTARAAVLQLQRTQPDTEQLVVCHGDYCLPNILIDDGRVAAYLDLGELGVADRWWDLAVATWSLTWNLGPGLEEHFLEAYGIEPDEKRIKFYRLLYDVVS